MNEQPDTLKGKLLVGIDLGTTNSGVALWNETEGKVVMLKNSAGKKLTPSVVGWERSQGQWIVGEAAKTLGLQHPQDVVYSIKRFIGRRFTDANVREGSREVTYKVVPGDGQDQLRDVIVELGADADGKPYRLSAPEISAKVLAKLRHDAAQALAVPLADVKYAVITVPAYFGMLQRRATIAAGQEAGLEVVDILNEPTAAALAYQEAIFGPPVSEPQERCILVYDLGGGTFDISLLEAKRDEIGYEFYTVVVDGDTALGGDDIDINVARWLGDEIEKQYGDPVRHDDYITRERLRQAAEQAKVALTDVEQVTIKLPDLDLGNRPPFDAELSLTRQQLEACASELLRRTREITRRAVEDVAEFTWDEIDSVLLVGGQTLMPAIQRDVADLTGCQPHVKDRPQLVVALGAGEYARTLSLGWEKFHENALINVIALSLGIRLDANTFKVLVPANETVPYISEPFFVTTTIDNQPQIEVEVLQGARSATRADQCMQLGSIIMQVPPAPAGTPKFEVLFSVQSDGTMQVIVEDKRLEVRSTLDIVETRQAWKGREQRFRKEKSSNGTP